MSDSLEQPFSHNGKSYQPQVIVGNCQGALWQGVQQQLVQQIPYWLSAWSQVHQPKSGCFYSDQSLSRLKDDLLSRNLQKEHARKLLKWCLEAAQVLSEFLPNNHKCRIRSQGRSARRGYKGKKK